METIEQYFERADTPSVGSPVGVTMVKVLDKYSQMNFEEARAKARELLSTSAKGRFYRTPRVLSAEELVLRAEQLKRAFPRAGTAESTTQNAL